MRLAWLMGLASCLALPACAPDSNRYYGNVQSDYDSYAQPGYVSPGYAQPGYLVPNYGPTYVQPYGYPGPGYGYGYGPDKQPG